MPEHVFTSTEHSCFGLPLSVLLKKKPHPPHVSGLFFAVLASASRYTVDNSSRFVPVGSAEKLKFSRQLKLDDNRGIHMPANVSQDLSPFTDMAEIGRVPEEMSPGDLGGFSSSTGDRRDLASSVVGQSSSGKASAKRAGGRLRPVTVHSTPPRKRAPVIRRCSQYRLVKSTPL